MIQNISTAVRWTDSLGDNIMIITKKIIKAKQKELVRDLRKNRYKQAIDFSTKETIPSMAYHFLIINDSSMLSWKVVAIAKLCDEEDGNHVKNWFVITDLNKDARAEVWLVYKGECLSEESQTKMRIIMCEANKRYTVSGPVEGSFPDKSYFDQNFKSAPPVFKQYAVQLWAKFTELN
jgi:hypothetical protein